MSASTMMDFPVTLRPVLERAGRLFGSSEIVSASRTSVKAALRGAYPAWKQRGHSAT